MRLARSARSLLPAAPSRRKRGSATASLAHALILALGLLLVSAGPALVAPVFPELTGRIVDNAGLINAEDRAAIEAELAALEAKSTDQIAVVTLPSLQGYEIEDFGYQLGRHWGIGQKDEDNGALLIIAPNERKVRIEVGRGLEPHLTDAMSRLIIDNAVLPAFRRGDFSSGIRAAVRDMKDVVLGDAESVKERARSAGDGPGADWAAIAFLLLWLAIFAFVIYAHYRQAKEAAMAGGKGGQKRRGRLRDGSIVIIPGGSGHWDGGGWDSGGGGGWSGGGGGFGGGGASGSW